eukprot:COSAG04_NODE_7123_length_1186_cov_1.199632_1_plen_201_part_00
MQPRCRGVSSRAVRADSVGVGKGLVRADVEVLVGEERCHLVEERRDDAERHIILSSEPKTLSFRPLSRCKRSERSEGWSRHETLSFRPLATADAGSGREGLEASPGRGRAGAAPRARGRSRRTEGPRPSARASLRCGQACRTLCIDAAGVSQWSGAWKRLRVWLWVLSSKLGSGGERGAEKLRAAEKRGREGERGAARTG